MALATKEIDIPLTSSIKQMSNPKKRNADYPAHHELMNSDPGVFTPRKPRTPAKFRLSVSIKKEPLFSLQEDRLRESLLTERKRVITSDFSSPDSVLPPPDFDEASYPRGWVVGKRRRLVNVDVVESMRRIAVHEMNRKDREITGLNEQLDEDARTMEFLQLQLQQERSRRLHAERDNAMLHGRIATIMSMFGEEELEEGQIEEEEQEDEEELDQASISSADEPPISDDQA
ncbi:hypothetical protein O6H91_06G070300 [Diphasiastrum complanatum]|uniref:Uncharacterized protein n=1 Tax=Diphasiastrum complanatum TaxID=34168 RepID=A0ACC2DEN7_DIPCM|nr:hypothetical protein O6H91_06G070300 [Diphasiastrum complanatum]